MKELKIGTRLSCRVYDIDKQNNVYFRLDNDDADDDTETNKKSAAKTKKDITSASVTKSKSSKQLSLITAKALRIHIDDVEKNSRRIKASIISDAQISSAIRLTIIVYDGN